MKRSIRPQASPSPQRPNLITKWPRTDGILLAKRPRKPDGLQLNWKFGRRRSTGPVNQLQLIEVSKVFRVRGDEREASTVGDCCNLAIHEGWCFAAFFKSSSLSSMPFRRDVIIWQDRKRPSDDTVKILF